MSVNADAVVQTFQHEAQRVLEHCHRKIHHCVGQLSDDQIWWRPNEGQNSIANLILHLIGNVRQWIISGVGAEPDTRDRPAEFADRSLISRAEVLSRLDTLIKEAHAVLASLDAENAIRPRRIQGFDGETGISAIFHSVAHFYGHMQEITFMTRMQLGDAYQFEWTPRTPEEGAATE